MLYFNTKLFLLYCEKYIISIYFKISHFSNTYLYKINSYYSLDELFRREIYKLIFRQMQSFVHLDCTCLQGIGNNRKTLQIALMHVN